MSEDEKIQIVAFSTNETNQTPNDIIDIFLQNNNNHQILKKSKSAIAFSLTLPNSINPSKVIICSVLNLNREYTGITDVNCYIFFINLEKEDSLDKFEVIFNYAKDYCELNKKIYVLGMLSKKKEDLKSINEEDITKTLDLEQCIYEYKEIDLSNHKEISDTIMDILVYSSKHSISGDDDYSALDKEGGNQGSCRHH